MISFLNVYKYTYNIKYVANNIYTVIKNNNFENNKLSYSLMQFNCDNIVVEDSKFSQNTPFEKHIFDGSIMKITSAYLLSVHNSYFSQNIAQHGGVFIINVASNLVI